MFSCYRHVGVWILEGARGSHKDAERGGERGSAEWLADVIPRVPHVK